MGKSVKSCKAEETAGPQRQSLEGGEGGVSPGGAWGTTQRDGSHRPPKRTILSSAPRVSEPGPGVLQLQIQTGHFVYRILILRGELDHLEK